MRRARCNLRRGGGWPAWLAVALLLAGCGVSGPPGQSAGGTADKPTPPEIVIDTSEGTIRLETLPDRATNTTSQVVADGLGGTYDGSTVLNVVPGTLLQIGPSTVALPAEGSVENSGLVLDRGMVALGWVGTPTRQVPRLIFPLTRLDSALDGSFSVFGRIVSGEAVLDRLTPSSTIKLISVRQTQPIFRITTQRGSIVVQMDPNVAPNTVTRIGDLICQGFYNGKTFSRVETFLIQGGGDSGNTMGTELSNKRFFRGAVGMASQVANPDVVDSQFFIMKTDVAQFDGKYTYFGQVISGMSAVDAIQKDDVINSIVLQFDLQGRDCTTSTGGFTPPPVTPVNPTTVQ